MCDFRGCTVPKNLRCFRLEHYGIPKSEWGECPNDDGSTFEWLGTRYKRHYGHDCQLAPGCCCEKCGTYWVPAGVTPEIVHAMETSDTELLLTWEAA